MGFRKIGFEESGGNFFLTKETKVAPLPRAVYEVHQSMVGFYLSPLMSKFEFPYKIYGMETELIDAAKNYYTNTESGNLGIMLNGVKGTGKTVTGKVLANELGLPVVIVGAGIAKDSGSGVLDFLNSIPQDIFIFLDEYEKIFGESSEVLSIMDGAANSPFRRVFLLTTNSLYVDRNLIDRPSRIRYLATFNNLSPRLVEELVDDILENKNLKDECIDFISRLSVITVDMVKSVISEVNIQNKSPKSFEKIFNASKIQGNFDVFEVLGEDKSKQLYKNVRIYPDPKNFTDDWVGRHIEFDGTYFGEVKKIIDYRTVIIKPSKRGAKEKMVRFEKSLLYNYSYGYGASMYDNDYVDDWY